MSKYDSRNEKNRLTMNFVTFSRRQGKGAAN